MALWLSQLLKETSRCQDFYRTLCRGLHREELGSLPKTPQELRAPENSHMDKPDWQQIFQLFEALAMVLTATLEETQSKNHLS